MERPPPGRELTLSEIEDVYRHQYRRFLRVALAILGDREAAHDAVQETFARAIRGRAAFRGEGSLEGWLWRTLTNHCRDLLAAPGRVVGADAPELEAAGNDHSVEHAELRAAIAALPERQRLAIFLRHYADLDYEQIAEATGVARGTVAATLHAARTALQRTLEGSRA